MNNRPTDEILMAYAAGTLPQGPALVVAAHLTLCPESRERVRRFETIGGMVLEDMPPVEMSADAHGASPPSWHWRWLLAWCFPSCSGRDLSPA
jgi:anti-sigma factor ChrR (cupin superfamily)